MGKFFDFEGPFFSFLDRLSDIVILNIIFIVCCIPVFTAGAALTALSSITQKMARKEEGYIFRGFFKSFKQNFLQATAIWLIMCFFAFVFFLDFRIMQGYGVSGVLLIAQGILFVLGMAYVFEFIYVFPLLARFDNTIMNTMRNALLLSIRYLPWTVLLLLLLILSAAAFYFYTGAAVPVFVLAGFSLISLISSYIFNRLFSPLIKDSETDGEG